MAKKNNEQWPNFDFAPEKKKSNRLLNVGLLVAVVFVGIFTFSQLGGEQETVSFSDEAEQHVEPVEDKPLNLPLEVIELGEISSTVFEKKKKPFDVFFNDEELTNEYGFYQDDQQSELLIVPTSTEYEVNVLSMELDKKEITIRYEYGNPKIPRVIGHITKFDAKAYMVNFRSVESAIYKVKFINELDETMQEEELDFTQPFYRSNWEVTNLAWGKDGTLVYASNIDGKWDLWGYNFAKEEEPIKLTDRHEDYPMDILTTLGVENVNTPIPLYNKKTEKMVYHADQDIFEVGSNGKGNYPLSINSEELPTPEGMYQFDNQPVPTNEGSYVYYRRIYDPQTSELWKMYYDGDDKTRVHLPKDGYLEEFAVSPKDDQLAVIVSDRKSDLMNGAADLWVLPIGKDAAEREEKKLTTVGYSLKYMDFSSNNKTIAFSMKEQPTTSDILTDIWTVNSNNTNLTRLTPKDDYMDIKPKWSPDGSKIAFLSGKGETFNLWVMDANGESRRALDRKIQVVGTPLWSEDGESIFISDIRGSIFEFNLTESKIYRVLKGY